MLLVALVLALGEPPTGSVRSARTIMRQWLPTCAQSVMGPGDYYLFIVLFYFSVSINFYWGVGG